MVNEKTKDDISRVFTAIRNYARYLIIKYFGDNGGEFPATKKDLYSSLYQYLIDHGENPADAHFGLSRLKNLYGMVIKENNRWKLTEYGWIAYEVILGYEEAMKKHKKDEG